MAQATQKCDDLEASTWFHTKFSKRCKYASLLSFGCLQSFENSNFKSLISISSLGMGLNRVSRVAQSARPFTCLMVSVVMNEVLRSFDSALVVSRKSSLLSLGGNE